MFDWVVYTSKFMLFFLYFFNFLLFFHLKTLILAQNRLFYGILGIFQLFLAQILKNWLFFRSSSGSTYRLRNNDDLFLHLLLFQFVLLLNQQLLLLLIFFLLLFNFQLKLFNFGLFLLKENLLIFQFLINQSLGINLLFNFCSFHSLIGLIFQFLFLSHFFDRFFRLYDR